MMKSGSDRTQGTPAKTSDAPQPEFLFDNDAYRFVRALVHGRTYFGPRMASAQGDPQRHPIMTALVAMLAAQGRTEINVLEVGSWAGGSTITWAQALEQVAVAGHVYCVDHWQQYLDLSANPAPHYREMVRAASSGSILGLFQHNIGAAGVGGRTVTLRGATRNVLPMLGGCKFDIVFIDASHLYADVLADLRDATTLVGDGGVLCGDDLELQLPDCDRATLEEAIRVNADYVTDPATSSGYHPGVTAAVAEVLGRVPEWRGFWAVRRDGGLWCAHDLPQVETEPPKHILEASASPIRVDLQKVSGFAIFDADDGAIGLAEGVRPEDLLLTPREMWDRIPLVIVGPDVDAVRRRIDALAGAARYSARTDVPWRSGLEQATPPILVRQDHAGFNVVRYGDRYYAVSQQVGPIDIATADVASLERDHLLVIGASEQDALLMVDGLQLVGVREKLAALEEQVSSLTRALDDARRHADGDQRFVETERRRADLEQQLRDLEERLAREGTAQQVALEREQSLAAAAQRIAGLERQIGKMADSHTQDLALAGQRQMDQDQSLMEIERRRADLEQQLRDLKERFTREGAAQQAALEREQSLGAAAGQRIAGLEQQIGEMADSQAQELALLRDRLTQSELERTELTSWVKELQERLVRTKGAKPARLFGR